jgi:uncharacterized protein (TIGR00661 family)
MMARIAYFVYGRGRGHASRASAVLARLAAEGHELHVFGGGHAVALLRQRRDFTEVEPCLPGPRLVPTAWRRVRQDMVRLRHLAPHVIVTDADLAAAHAALLLKLPTLAVGHGMLYWRCRLGPGLPRFERLREALRSASSSWPCRYHVVVHFAPVEVWAPHTTVARPDLPRGLVPCPPEDFVLAYFRDANGETVLRQLAARGHRIICFGMHDTGIPGVTSKPLDANTFSDHLARCRFVVGSAGNHLPAECAMMQKPMLTVYAPGDVEHRMNAKLIEAAGIGIAARLDQVTPAILNRFDLQLAKSMADVAKRVHNMPPVSEAVTQCLHELISSTSEMK